MAPKTIKKCPICGKLTDPTNRDYPFCSERCRVIDLANWSSEQYVVHRPLRETDEDTESSEPEGEEM